MPKETNAALKRPRFPISLMTAEAPKAKSKAKAKAVPDGTTPNAEGAVVTASPEN